MNRYANLSLFPIYSPVLDVLVIPSDPSKPMSAGAPSFALNQADLVTGVDLYSIPYGVLVALRLNKTDVVGTYASPGEAAALDGKSDNKYIGRYINLERPVNFNGQDVYFVMHPD